MKTASKATLKHEPYIRRRICVVTGSRAEYGLLYWLMKEIQGDPDLKLQVMVTGAHLSPEFGLTWKQIEEDGFEIDEKVEMLLSSDTPAGIAKSTGLGIIGFADAFARLKPDLVVLLGDRFEIFASAATAHIARIPIAHIHGGETTEGAIDEAFRHAVTKMSQIHLVAAEPYRKRVIQMGEDPSRVFLTGAPGLDHLEKTSLLRRDEIEDDLGIQLEAPVFLVTYHPVTLHGDPKKPFGELLTALEEFPDASIVFTHSNADTEWRALTSMIEDHTVARPDRIRSVASLGQRRYLSLLKICDAVVGNSSSGLTEAPSFGVPTVNIGDRQKGRLKASSVLDCPEERGAISETIRIAISPAFKEVASNTQNPYGSGGASEKIKQILKEIPLEGLLEKSFYDLPLPEEPHQKGELRAHERN